MKDNAELIAQFNEAFNEGGTVRVVRAPGRVNLIGEHTDYNDGFVFPMAIEPDVRLVCRQRGDGMVRLASQQYHPQRIEEFSIQQPVERLNEKHWSNYPRGVCAMLLRAGVPLVGMDALIANSLAVGGGLSSSAALETGTGVAMLALAGIEMDRMRLAELCQAAEHEFAGVPCGLMDQMIVGNARENCATMFDCRHKTMEFAPLNGDDLRVVIVNSGKKHDLATNEYALRRKQCEQAVATLKGNRGEIVALRDVTLPEVESAAGKMGEKIYRRAHHVVSENQRTLDAVKALRDSQYEKFGRLMVASHESLRDDYEVSCIELDYLVEQAMSVRGIYGARMTGGGFGGCIVALAQPNAVDALGEHLKHSYKARFNITPEIFVTSATGAAAVI